MLSNMEREEGAAAATGELERVNEAQARTWLEWVDHLPTAWWGWPLYGLGWGVYAWTVASGRTGVSMVVALGLLAWVVAEATLWRRRKGYMIRLATMPPEITRVVGVALAVVAAMLATAVALALVGWDVAAGVVVASTIGLGGRRYELAYKRAAEAAYARVAG